MAYKQKPGLYNASITGTATEQKQVEVEILDASDETWKVVVEVVETPTMPPARYVIVEFHEPDGTVAVLRKVFLGAVLEGANK